MALVTLEETTTHLRIDAAEVADLTFRADLQLKIDIASALVLRYMGIPEATYPTPTGVPFHLKSATLIWAGILFKHRDGSSDEPFVYGQIPIAVSNILVHFRVPPIA